MLYATITLGSSFSQFTDISHSLTNCPHIRDKKSVHLYVIPSPLPVSKGKESWRCTFLIPEITIYPKAKYHSTLQNNTTFSASV